LLFPSVYYLFSTHPLHTHIYTLSLHDALPISRCDSPNDRIDSRTSRDATPPSGRVVSFHCQRVSTIFVITGGSLSPAISDHAIGDRKSTRLNSSHLGISYAVFCLKKIILHNTT